MISVHTLISALRSKGRILGNDHCTVLIHMNGHCVVFCDCLCLFALFYLLIYFVGNSKIVRSDCPTFQTSTFVTVALVGMSVLMVSAFKSCNSLVMYLLISVVLASMASLLVSLSSRLSQSS